MAARSFDHLVGAGEQVLFLAPSLLNISAFPHSPHIPTSGTHTGLEPFSADTLLSAE